MNMSLNKTQFILFFILGLFFSCTYEKEQGPIPESNYPPAVAEIIVNKCATSGCHNSLSRANAGGLDYSTWDLMF